MTSRDRGVQRVFRCTLDKEVLSNIMRSMPATLTQQVFAEDPGTTLKSLSNRSNKRIQADKVAKCLARALSLNTQGEIFRIKDGKAPAIWSKVHVVQSLPSKLFKVHFKCMLPHNAILAHWYILSGACKLCGGRQTILHVLNRLSTI